MRIAVGVLALLLTSVLSAAPRGVLPSLVCETDDGQVALAIDAMRVRTLIRGHLARTTFDITFRNDLDRDLDGQFSFPLPADAEVSEIGLYFDGVLRKGVAVERVQARAAYDETVHRRVDPALAEWSSSTRAFRFRVYPIPARGMKVVHIAYDQELTNAPYELDLRGDVPASAIDWQVDSDAPVERDGPAFVRVTREPSDVALAAFSPSERMWYFSAAPQLRSTAPSLPPASNVTLLYDVSSSAVQRNDTVLREFLRTFLAQQQPGVRVTVVPFHVSVEPSFETDANALEARLAELPYAGATNLAGVLDQLPAIIARTPPASRLVLITDGIHTLGDSRSIPRAIASLPRFDRPLIVVNASPSADDHTLSRLAAATGGVVADLTRGEASRAVAAAMRYPRRIALTSTGDGIREVLPRFLTEAGDAPVSVHARGLESLSWLPILGTGIRRELLVRELGTSEERDLVRQSWARAALRELLARDASSEAVLAHGLRFQQITPQTSLLVLDTWQDYVAYGIPVPTELRAQRERELAEEAERQRRDTGGVVMRGIDTAEASRRAGWFIRGTLIIDDAPLPGGRVELLVDGRPVAITITDAEGRFWLMMPRAPRAFVLRASLEGLETVTQSYPRGAAKGSIVEVVLRLASVTESITVTAEGPAIDGAASVTSVASNLVRPSPEALADAVIVQIPAVKLEERLERIGAVVDRMRTLASAEERFRYYVAARSAIGGDKFFQAHAALALHDEAPELAVRALTDLAETNPDDAPTLRLIGRVLDGWGFPELARLMFERALELSPRETQTWRELLLLTARTQPAEALEKLEQRYASAQRDGRMVQTETALAAELARKSADRRVDEGAELQVEVMWDSNYMDIDLHVTEPDGEEVSYGHRKSTHGGTLHDDVTGGFGPETYTLPRMESGTYEIALDYYSRDTTRLGLAALAHVIVYVRGQRSDYFVALTGAKDGEVVARVRR